MGYWTELRSWLLKDPGKLIRYLVLFVCIIIVITQLYECFSKLQNPPISTHSYYNLNDTIEMPAVTICREPPYKEAVLSNISKSVCSHPRFTNCWANYPYGEVAMDEFFMNSTYDLEETFSYPQYGLDGLMDNLEITSSIHFNMGRCHTLRPKIALKRTTKESGYSVMLTHHINPNNNNKYYEKDPGWHIFLHDYRENFTEINMKGSGRVEYVFAEINEEIEIKLQSQFFSNVETRTESCSRVEGYSDLKCGEVCIWKNLSKMSNCTGPWMHEVPEDDCENYKSMKNLTIEYGKVYNGDREIYCDCMQPCVSRIYSTYIQNRKNYNQTDLSTQVWIYYTTKLISMIEERPSYDTTQFIADIGGSLGFLLGLSVLGLIGILENLTLFFCGGVIKKFQMKNEKRQKLESDQQSQQSDETVDVATIYKTKHTKKTPV
ncbi:uncharacterized protein LOC119688336 [Teleopsis dalmanni]|uniref:uncharacterized protein LOC119688336 n=1 Tax=Teleopsis dalmanni TaxID=139649 RepID=UPI0018CF0C81|nr:uncharacterized protein LOC119688336 [Teleopsis dalmanni]